MKFQMILLDASIYTEVKTVVLYATAIAAIVAGFKIYQQWQAGEPVIGSILIWLMGIIVATALISLTTNWIANGSIQSKGSISVNTIGLARESYSLSLVLGVALAMLAVVDIYRKQQNGDDVIELIFKWVGSLFFLFSFGYAIELLMS